MDQYEIIESIDAFTPCDIVNYAHIILYRL